MRNAPRGIELLAGLDVRMGPIAVHHTATSEGAFDGPANETRVKTEQGAGYYRRIYAWQDPDGDVGTKAAWRFIHHEVNGDGDPGAASIRACQAGIGVLNGARGGTTIPDADRRGVYNHLAAHLRDADLEPAELRAFSDVERVTAFQGIRFTNQGESSGNADELWIYDEIGGFFGITSADVVRALQASTSSELVVHLNSPGGSVFEGIAMHTALRQHPARVRMEVDALAASAASFVAMAGDEILLAPAALLMIHGAEGITEGPESEHRKMADILHTISEGIAGLYARRAGGKVADWLARMESETWYTAEQAVAAGLADGINDAAPVATNLYDVSRFRNAPPELLGIRNEGRRNAQTDLERIQLIHDLSIELGASSPIDDRAPVTGQGSRGSTPQDRTPLASPLRARLALELAELGVT